MKLVDVNLLVYAVNPGAPLHARARAWLEQTLSGSGRVALPWVVVLGFLRVTTRPGAFARPLSVKNASGLVEAWLRLDNVLSLVPGENHWPILSQLLAQSGTAGNVMTDAHLAALAIEHDCELCSTDGDFARFDRLRWTNPLALPPASGRRR